MMNTSVQTNGAPLAPPLSLRLVSPEKPKALFEWTRGDVCALALNGCADCRGKGLVLSRGKRLEPCHCALREIFRQCYKRWQRLSRQDRSLSCINLAAIAERRAVVPAGTCITRKFTWGRRDEEFIADFELVSRRTLTGLEHRLFVLHFLNGADWKACCPRLGLTCGNFFHSVYRIEEKLGRAFREVRPYSLYPISRYFNGYTRNGEMVK